MSPETLITLSLSAIVLIVCIVTLIIVLSQRTSSKSQSDQAVQDSQTLLRDMQQLSMQSSQQMDAVSKVNDQVAQQTIRIEDIDKHVISRQETMNQTVTAQMKTLDERFAHFDQLNEQKLEALRQSMVDVLQRIQNSVGEQLDSIRQENAKKLDEIRGTVDEKLQDTLQKRIAESFQTVSQQLEQVYKGLGDMQHLATDVGGLKQVLSGVKTRGILGEIQLGAILEEILSPEQYETNVATVPGSANRVEFAIKLPGNDGDHVYLPIDSKFPGDSYMHLQEAQLAGDATVVSEAKKNLERELKKSAGDIAAKYVDPPHTTTFGIMFLPFEGLYAEVVNQGWIEMLQREYNINVAGPSTMAALLNSLQMGFKTLAIQKRSNEVWKVLGEVKAEFAKFEGVMTKMQRHLRQTSDDLDSLMGTRTRAINRKLRDVHQLDSADGYPDGDADGGADDSLDDLADDAQRNLPEG